MLGIAITACGGDGGNNSGGGGNSSNQGVHIEGVERTGVTMALSGSVAIASECENGTFTVSTPAEDLPFIPDDEECAVQGRILVSDGMNTTAVIATSTGGVRIDNGNNGSVDREFSDCSEAEACAENA